MKKFTFFFFLPFLIQSINAQHLEVDGHLKITGMEADSTSTAILVRKADSTLAFIDSSNIQPTPWQVGQEAYGGIVFHVYIGSDGRPHGLIVSTIETTAQWQNVANGTMGNRSWDGAYNTGLMFQSPAKDWVRENFPLIWHMPSIDELSMLWHNRYVVNQALAAGGHTPLAPTGLYWSSTENNNALAYFFGFGDGDSEDTGKTNAYKVRAVRPF